MAIQISPADSRSEKVHLKDGGMHMLVPLVLLLVGIGGCSIIVVSHVTYENKKTRQDLRKVREDLRKMKDHETLDELPS